MASALQKTAPTPIIAGFFYVLAALAAVGTIGTLVMAHGAGYRIDLALTLISGCISVLLLFGCGQIISLLGRAAHFAEYNAQRADEQRELTVSLLNELNKHSIILGKLLEEADETAGDRYSSSEEARKFYEKALLFQARADAQREHGNALLKWIGESRRPEET